jgi:cell division protein FtsB
MSTRLHSRSKGATSSKWPTRLTHLRRPRRSQRSGPKRSHPKRSHPERSGLEGKARGLTSWRRTDGTRLKTTNPGSKSKQRPTSALTRRSRIPLALAALFSLAILGTSFPASALLAQHHQLSAASGQLTALQKDNRSLAEQERQLSSKADIDRLARQDYQLVEPGQTLYDVLPPSGKSTTTAPGGFASGDPGDQPLVDPANAPDMSPDPGLAQQAATSGSAGSGGAKTDPNGSTAGGSSGSSGSAAGTSPSSFWSRVANTLEFWK